MTRQLDLRGGRPVWVTYRAPIVPVKALRRDVSCDVAVIGMGISGAMLAESLTAAGLSVVVLDRRGPMQGSTMATTALVQFEIDQPLSELTKKLGRAKAERAWNRSRSGVANLQTRIEDLGLACDLIPRTSLLIAGNQMGAGDLREEAELRSAAGIYARYLTRSELLEGYGIDREGAILSFGNLAINPRKLTARLHLTAQARGARYFTPVEATSLNEHSDHVVIETDVGRTVTAKHVVLATGYELLEPAPHSGHRIVSTFAIATRPQRANLWKDECFIWEASDPYLYMRTLPDGRVICGGEDEDFTDEDKRDDLIDAKADRIARKLAALMPGLNVEPELRWSGSFGVTETGLPRIGALPRHPRVFAVQGYGGNGITYSRIGAEIITGAITERPDSDADLFAFSSGVGILRSLIPSALA